MNIRHRILMLVLMTLSALLAIGTYSVYKSRTNATAVRIVTEGVVPSALASADLLSRLKDVQLSARAIVSAPDLEQANQITARLEQQKLVLTQSLQAQGNQADSKSQQGLIAQVNESLHDYFGAINDTVHFKLAGNNVMAEANLNANAAVYQREIEQIVDTLRIEKNRSKDEAIASLNQALEQTVQTVLLITLTVLAALAAIGWLLYRQITLPIAHMQAKMTHIASTQDFSSRVPVERQDEIGRSIMAFNSMIARIQESDLQLRKKTNDIHAMLQNLPEGILTIGADGTVDAEYSAFLQTILETGDIAGQPAMTLIFGNSDVGDDALAQVEATLFSCIGEDRMNFDFNAHLLIGEFNKHLPDGRSKCIDLSWAPICNDDDSVEKMLVCMRDVSHLREVEAEAAHQKRELDIISQLLAISREKFHEFADGATTLLGSNEALLKSGAAYDGDLIGQLFRNMHTIKGNARTYGLRQLTDCVHQAEQTYDDLRNSNGSGYDTAALLAQLKDVRQALEEYEHVNNDKLGRKGAGRRGRSEQYLLAEREPLERMQSQLSHMDISNCDHASLIAALEDVRLIIGRIGASTASQMLDSVFRSLPSLAQELGKTAPSLQVDDKGILIRNELAGLLGNTFTHLYRNAIDHGIELPEVRIAHGKPAAGTIWLNVDVCNDRLVFRLQDDGRGLALKSIYRKAIEKGILSVNSVASDEEIANIIFAPGFSTAQAVSDISGRGVGMDAVQDFVRREGGDVRLVFTGDDAGSDYRRFATLITLPEKFVLSGGNTVSSAPETLSA